MNPSQDIDFPEHDPEYQELDQLRGKLAELERDNRALVQDLDRLKQLEDYRIQSQKMEALSRLAGRIAHDFNNFLTVINGYSTMLAERLDLSDEVVADVQSIRKAGERATSLMSQLLAFVRNAPAATRIVSLKDALQAIEQRRQALPEGIQTSINFREMDILVNMDPAQLDRILTELFNHSRDSVGESGVIEVEIGKEWFDETTANAIGKLAEGYYATVTVKYSGRLPEEARKRLFEPFFTTKELGHGSGLGLATVYSLVDQNQGAAVIQNLDGEGICFRIFLPLAGEESNVKPAVL